jgi:hypothetical protein
MTDITFAAFSILALLFLHRGVERSRPSLMAIGLSFSLLAILTRQIGVIIPVAFVAASWLHPGGRGLGRWRILFLSAGLTLLPWLTYELFLWHVGSTPIVKNQVFQNVYRHVTEKGLSDYLVFLYVQCVHHALSYVAFFTSPVSWLGIAGHWSHKGFRAFLWVITAIFLLLEGAILAGTIDPPVLLYRNVIVDWGIGPILLKDTYILGIPRLSTMPKPLYYLCVYMAVVSALILLVEAASFLRLVFRTGDDLRGRARGFFPLFTLLSLLGYLGIITLTGFHDRYLIPACMLAIVWLVSSRASRASRFAGKGALAVSFATVALLGAFSVTATRDFMETKRAVKQAHDYLMHEIKVDPCRVDGGFEFNGYHCYRPDFTPREGLSWWWVEEEQFLVALGELPGFEVIRRYPFRRTLGKDGVVHVLRRAS